MRKTTNDPAVLAIADQMEAAIMHAASVGNRNLMRDEYCRADALTVSRGLTTFLDSQSESPFPIQRAVLVRGDWTADRLRAFDAGLVDDTEWVLQYADELPANDDVISDLEEPRCRRCWDGTGLVAATNVIWATAGGCTVVEFAFCDACATDLDNLCGELDWKRRGSV